MPEVVENFFKLQALQSWLPAHLDESLPDKWQAGIRQSDVHSNGKGPAF